MPRKILPKGQAVLYQNVPAEDTDAYVKPKTSWPINIKVVIIIIIIIISCLLVIALAVIAVLLVFFVKPPGR